jgi:hypothetical protein
MIDIEMIPSHVMDDLQERGLSVELIRRSSPEFLFSEYCNWHGLIGWGAKLMAVSDALRDSALDRQNHD